MTGAWEGAARSRFASTAGGVMTEEAGAVTGELELLTRPAGDAVEVLVRYAGTEEWYTVTGAPVHASDADPGGHERGHEAIRARLTTPGRVDEGGNELPVDLRD